MNKFYTVETIEPNHGHHTSYFGATEGKSAKYFYNFCLKRYEDTPGTKILLRSWVSGEMVMHMSNFEFREEDCTAAW